jgi:hypothetical protein
MIDQGATLPATTVVEAGASGRVGAYLLVGRIEDVFDVRPATRSGYHTAGRVVSVAVQGEWR